MKSTKKAAKSSKKSVLAVKSKVKAGLLSSSTKTSSDAEGCGVVCKGNSTPMVCC